MNLYKIYLCVLCFGFLGTFAYAQQDYNEGKDFRLKKYQTEIINFLFENEQFGNKNLRIKDYSQMIFVFKTIEIFPWSAKPKKPSVLLVAFGSTSSHANTYWALLESDRKFLFKNKTIQADELMNHMKIYDEETKDIILFTLKLYKKFD